MLITFEWQYMIHNQTTGRVTKWVSRTKVPCWRWYFVKMCLCVEFVTGRLFKSELCSVYPSQIHRLLKFKFPNTNMARCSDFIMCNVKCCACSRIAWNSHSFLIIVNGYGNDYNAVWVHCKVLSSSSLHRYVAWWKLCLFVMYSKSYWQDLKKKKHFIMFCSFLCLSVDF